MNPMIISRTPLTLCAALALLASASRLSSEPPSGRGAGLDGFLDGVEKHVLPNGLTLLTRYQEGGGVVAINTWVKAGYFNEPDQVAGMAHLFEHMFFKGSKGFPGAEDIAKQLAAVGGVTNAGTIYDSTSYYFVVPREGFRRAVEIQADAIMNPLFDPAELEKESEVVIEESNRKLDNPPAVSMERMFETAFTKHRMKRWRIGSNDVLRAIERDNLLAFFETLYRPENIILTIAGDVPHEEARRAALETFGKIPRGVLKKDRGPAEPVQESFRYGRSEADIKQGYSVFGWHTPGVGHPDQTALEILARILGGSRASRLFVHAVGPGAASTVNADHLAFDDVGMVTVQASFDEANRAEVDRRTLAEVERLKAHGPTAFELQRAKNAIESALATDLEDALGQAQTLSMYEARHGYEAIAARTRELRATGGEAVRDAARRYLVNGNLTLYHYAPRGASPSTRDSALAAALEAARSAPAPIPGRDMPPQPEAVRAAGSDASVRETALANGASLIVKERQGAPLVSIGVYFEGGRADESSRNAGITQLMARAMRKGTSSRTAEQIDGEIEFLGTQLGFDVTEDFFGFTLDVLNASFSSGLEILSDVVLDPTFPAEGVEEEKALQSAAIKRSLDSSFERPMQLLSQALYGPHPYALPANGYLATVQSMGPEALREWWKSHVVADGAVVIVAGDIATGDAKRIVEERLGRLPKRLAPRPPVPQAPAPEAHLEVSEHRDRKQSAIAVGFPTVPRGHEDWPSLRLLSNITSGLAGTFFAELRGNRSLAYTVFAADTATARSGAFLAYLASEATKEREARDALLAEIRKLPVDEFGEEDLARAKAYLSGSTRIRMQRNGAHVADLARNRYHGLPLDFTWKMIDEAQAITLDRVRATAGKYLAGERFAEAVLRGKP